MSRIPQSGNLVSPRYDWLVVLGVVLYPIVFTGSATFRLGEMIILVWTSIALFHRVPRISFPTRDLQLWLALLFVITLGYIVGSSDLHSGSNSQGLLTWAYLAVVYLSVLGAMRTQPLEHRLHMLRSIGVVGTTFYGALLVYGEYISGSIAGIDLYYGSQRFSSGGDNPHHLALLISVTLAINVWMSFRAVGFWRRCGYVALVALSFWIVGATASSTAVVAVALSLLSLLALYTAMPTRLSAGRVVAFILLFVGIAFSGRLLSTLAGFVDSDPNGGGRLELLEDFPTTFARSPVVGLGPGAHAGGGTIEFHNSFVEILVMAGIVGFILFSVLIGRVLFHAARRDLLLALPIIVAVLYGVGGFSARRLAFWVILAIVGSIAFDSDRRDSCHSIDRFRVRNDCEPLRRYGRHADVSGSEA